MLVIETGLWKYETAENDQAIDSLPYYSRV